MAERFSHPHHRSYEGDSEAAGGNPLPDGPDTANTGRLGWVIVGLESSVVFLKFVEQSDQPAEQATA